MFMFTVGLLAFINVRLDTTIQDNNKHMSQIVHAADDDKDKDKDKDKDDDTKDDKIKQSYASKLFDASKSKNQSLMYYKNQTKAGAPTVESVIDDESENKTGEAYASFLKAQNKWNLYKTYTSQLDTGTGIIRQIIKWLFGGALLICLYLMDAVDGLIKIIGE